MTPSMNTMWCRLIPPDTLMVRSAFAARASSTREYTVLCLLHFVLGRQSSGLLLTAEASGGKKTQNEMGLDSPFRPERSEAARARTGRRTSSAISVGEKDYSCIHHFCINNSLCVVVLD